MTKPEINYGLPISCLEVDGTITETWDTILGEATVTPVTTVALHTHGIDRDQTLQILTGPFRDTSLSLQLTEDGLLSSAVGQSTGQLGKVLVGVVGVGVAVAGVLTGLAPAGAAAAAVNAGLVRHEVAAAYLPGVADQTSEEKVAEAYAERYPTQAALRARYAALVDGAVQRIAAIAEGVQGGPGIGSNELSEIRRQQELLAALRAELEPLDAHFESWRAGVITTHVTKQQRCFSLDTLRGADVRVSAGEITFSPHADEPVRFAWNKLGVAITMDPAGTPRQVPRGTRANEVIVRLPRRIRLSVYENVDGKPVLREERPYLVVDAACETRVVQFRRSLWAKRSTTLGFSDLGVLTRYAVGSTSSAAAAADSAGQLQQSVASDLDEPSKVDQQLTEMVSADGRRKT